MMLLLLFLLSGVGMGYVLSWKFKFIESAIERAAFSLIVGLSISTFVSFWISFAFGSLSTISIAAGIIVNICAIASIYKIGRERIPRIKIPKPKIGLAEICILAVFIVLAYFNSISIYSDAEGNISGISNAWADYAFHVGLINSFALRDNFPPVYPILEGAQMRYPFLVDFLSAIFVKEGVPIDLSITIPNFLLLFCLIGVSFAFLRRFLGNKEAAAIAIIIFFFNGNLGFMSFMDDYGAAPDKAIFLDKLPKAYSYLPERNIQFMNLSYSVFIPQRAALMGFPIAALAFLLLLRIIRREAEFKEMVLVALLVSILPLIHAASFGVAAFILFFAFVIDLAKTRKFGMRWRIAALLFLLIALPQLAFINEQERRGDFFGPEVGWMSRATNYEGFANFWWENIGVILILGICGLFVFNREQIVFSAPFLALFIVCNLIRFQPWEWDNVKVLMYWLFFMCAAGGLLLMKTYYRFKRMGVIWQLAAIALIIVSIFLSTFSALLTFDSWNSSAAKMWTGEDRRIADYVVENTDKNAVFLTAGKHNQLIYTLAGRQILAGYDGHLWSHGLIYNQQQSASRQIYSTADISLIRRWKIDYVYIGPQELYEWGAQTALFENNPDFVEVYFNKLANARIFKVNEA
ncbi:MAG: hypothetical protein V1835_00195 [Candidatus Micrarchaeota archaeon]